MWLEIRTFRVMFFFKKPPDIANLNARAEEGPVAPSEIAVPRVALFTAYSIPANKSPKIPVKSRVMTHQQQQKNEETERGKKTDT